MFFMQKSFNAATFVFCLVFCLCQGCGSWPSSVEQTINDIKTEPVNSDSKRQDKNLSPNSTEKPFAVAKKIPQRPEDTNTKSFKKDKIADSQQDISATIAEEAQHWLGFWAVDVQIPVTWRGNIGIRSGQGSFQLRLALRRKLCSKPSTNTPSNSNNQKLEFCDSYALCDLKTPEHQSAFLIGQQYATFYHDSLFDTASPIKSQGRSYAKDHSLRSTAHGQSIELQIGYHNPQSFQAWPKNPEDVTNLFDSDDDGYPAATMWSKTEHPYSFPPRSRNPWGAKVAAYFTASRFVFSNQATLLQENYAKGTISIADIDGKTAIDLHIVGCLDNEQHFCDSSASHLADDHIANYQRHNKTPATLKMLKRQKAESCQLIRHLDFSNLP